MTNFTDQQSKIANAVGYQHPKDYRWTESTVDSPLTISSPQSIVDKVIGLLQARHFHVPGGDATIKRCVHALLVGHLVLQGPPGTGKTTLAHALAEAFDAALMPSTATSEWTPFHVVGGLRPNAAGGLVGAAGYVTRSVIECAERVRSEHGSPGGDGADAPKADSQGATWLLIDEFNRADIDKAIGSLYTMLSSCSPTHLKVTPLDLWFESEANAQKVWVPARYRIIAAMNDLDTSFVNRMSQGLTRRFQFVTIGTFTSQNASAQANEMGNALLTAANWLQSAYRDDRPQSEVISLCEAAAQRLDTLIGDLRTPGADMHWPLGTAQVIDVAKAMVLETLNDEPELWQAVDHAVADRIVPQMVSVDPAQRAAYKKLFTENDLPSAELELTHLTDPFAL